jgi:hypothetical protein
MPTSREQRFGVRKPARLLDIMLGSRKKRSNTASSARATVGG